MRFFNFEKRIKKINKISTIINIKHDGKSKDTFTTPT